MADNHLPTEATAAERLVRGVLSRLHFCRPGYVEAFDPATQLAEVTPAVMSKRVRDGKAEYVKFPLLVQVPVCVPYVQALGLALTLPLRKGDEGLLLFADRALDDFIENGSRGGKAKPETCGADNLTTEPRMHSLSDAWFLPGAITQPEKLSNWNTEAMELRTKDGNDFIRLGAGGYGIRLTSGGGYDQGGADIRMKDGKIWFYARDKIINRNEINRREMPPEATGETGEPTMPE